VTNHLVDALRFELRKQGRGAPGWVLTGTAGGRIPGDWRLLTVRSVPFDAVFNPVEARAATLSGEAATLLVVNEAYKAIVAIDVRAVGNAPDVASTARAIAQDRRYRIRPAV
jgi:hypothetical protein